VEDFSSDSGLLTRGGRREVQAEVQEAQAKAAAKRMGEEVQVRLNSVPIQQRGVSFVATRVDEIAAYPIAHKI